MSNAPPIDPSLIPTPEEIARVTSYLQAQSEAAQAALLAEKRALAEQQAAGAGNLIMNGTVIGADFIRRGWDDDSVPWNKRGDIYEIRLDLDDGSQVFLGINDDGDALTLDINLGSNPNPTPTPPPEEPTPAEPTPEEPAPAP